MEFIQLALDHKPLNLGQGFPDFAAPEHVSRALADATLSTNVLLNQYTRGFVGSTEARCCSSYARVTSTTS